MKPRCKILIIAGSDSSGGAGIQADIKTVTALGGYAMTAITAITSQNSTGVKSVSGIKSQEVKNQIVFTSKDIKPDVIKIGMLNSSEIILSVTNTLKKIRIKKIVLDPVMVAKGGYKLINDKAISALKKYLIPKVFLLTPNIPEAEVLTGYKIRSLKDMIRAAKILNKLGVKNILLKGGHRDGKIVTDILLNKKKLVIYKNKKIKTKNTHGTGCTLSSAVATFIACGKTINKSCELAIKYVNESIRSNPNFGKGHGPINHLSSIRIDRKYK